MSETDIQRLKLVGVGPNSRSMKFLNTKNNIADKKLKRQLLVIEKQQRNNLNVIEHQKIDAKHFLKTVKNLDHETQEAKTLLRKDDLESITPPPKVRKERRRKIRLAQTAPAHMNHSDGKHVGSKADIERKMMKSGPETTAEKNKMLQIDRKKSMFLQLPGSGRNRIYNNNDEKPRTRFSLPKPSSKSLLDVMIGLNAFSFVPTPTNRDSGDESRSETRSSIFERDSMYDSSENIAKKFISNWRKKIASRKQSIFQKLDNEVGLVERERPLFRSDSIATSCIPEENSLQNSFRRRKVSKWTMRHSMRPTTLPTIDDEAERMEQFVQYVREAKEKEKQEIHPAFTNCGEDKIGQRRKSFVNWLQERKERPRDHIFSDDDDDDEEELTYRGVSLQHKDVDLQPTDLGDLMKTILKIKTTFRDPLDSRVKRFIRELEKMKERDDATQIPLSKKERQRRWVALTRGIDAALADSSDDEDYTYYNAY